MTTLRLQSIAATLERIAAGASPTDAERRALKQLAGLCAGREFLTTGQAADRLGITANTIKAWITEGLLPGARWAENRWQIPLQSVIDLEAEFAESDRRNAERDFMPRYNPRRKAGQAF